MQKSISFLTLPLFILGMMVACSSQSVDPKQPGNADIPAPSATQPRSGLGDSSLPADEPELERDLVVAYVASISDVPIPGDAWILQDGGTLETESVSTWLYTNGPWVVNISSQADPERKTAYFVIVDHMSAVIRWEGVVNSFGKIIETDFSQGHVPETPETGDEVFWIGVLVSNPPDSQFDDYFQMMDQNGTRCGVDGVDDAIKIKLLGYRDSGIVIQVWGRLMKDVPDAYGTQILVSRIGPYSQ